MFKLLHMPRCREVIVNEKGFDTDVDAKSFLTTHELYYLSEQDAYVVYEKKALESIRIPVDDFISNSNGYRVQPCEVEIVERHQ